MNASNHSLLAGVCAAVMLGGCAQIGPTSEHAGLKVAPVYRVQQPAGTAAGQYAVGRSDLAEGRVGAAIERFRNALKLDPGFVEAHNGLGVAFGMQGRYAESADAFRLALALGPSSAHVLNNLGFAQMKTGNLHDARQSFARSLEIDPKNARTRDNVRVLAALEQQDHRTKQAPAIPAAAPGREVAKAMPETAAEVAPPPPGQSASILSRSNESMLVRLAPNLYELRRIDAEAGLQRVPAGTAVPAVAAAAVTVTPAPTVSSQPAAQATRPLAAASSAPVAPLSTITAVPRAVPAKAKEMRTPVRKSATRIGRFEVSNGAGVERLAARTAIQFARFGVGISRVSNYESFDRVRTEIHYRKGFLKQAQLVQQKLPVQAKLVATDRLRPEINVRLVVGRDMVQAPIAWWGEETIADAEPTAGAANIAANMQKGGEATVLARAAVDGWRYL